MASETSQIIERGVATLPDETWEQAVEGRRLSAHWLRLKSLDTGLLMRQLLRWVFPGGRYMF